MLCTRLKAVWLTAFEDTTQCRSASLVFEANAYFVGAIRTKAGLKRIRAFAILGTAIGRFIGVARAVTALGACGFIAASLGATV